MLKRLVVFLAVALLAGACATTPISSKEAEPVPLGRQLRFQNPAPGTVPVLIMRDTGITASACATSVYVNGEVAAYVRSGEKVTLNIPAGDVILGVQPDGVCGLGGGLVELEAKVQPGRLMHYRIGYDQSGSVGLYRTIER